VRSTHFLRVALACAVLAIGVAGCGSAPTSPDVVPFSQVDLKLGTGTEAVSGKTLSVNYTGWLLDPSKGDEKGLQFDTTVGRAVFTFTLGTNQVIAGWDQGIPGMKIGGLRRLVIPPSLAYGGLRNGPIPPNATLVFEIELVDVQ
jgi:FKBP-type peptidyl-prolyl cis-trans isomerase FkpA